MPARRFVPVIAPTVALVAAIVAVAARRTQQPRTAGTEAADRPWPTADVRTPFPTDLTALRWVLQSCPGIVAYVPEDIAYSERVSAAFVQRIWRFEPAWPAAPGTAVPPSEILVGSAPVDDGDSEGAALHPTDRFLAALLADGVIASTVELTLDEDGTVDCTGNEDPAVADQLETFAPGDQLVNVRVHGAYDEANFRLSDGLLIPLDEVARMTTGGVQPYAVVASIVGRTFACFPDCAGLGIPTPIRPVQLLPTRTPTPVPTETPMSHVAVGAMRIEEIGPTWQVGTARRTTAGRFVVVEVLVYNGNDATLELTSPPTVLASDGITYAALRDVAGLLPEGPDCVLAPVPAGGELRCTLAFDLPLGARDPHLVATWVDAVGAGYQTQQLRLPSDGYPAPTP